MGRPGDPLRKGWRESKRGRRGRVRGGEEGFPWWEEGGSFGRAGLETAGDGGFCLPGDLPAGVGESGSNCESPGWGVISVGQCCRWGLGT